MSTVVPGGQDRRLARPLEIANRISELALHLSRIRPFTAVSDQILTERLRRLSDTPRALLLSATMIALSVDYCAYT